MEGLHNGPPSNRYCCHRFCPPHQQHKQITPRCEAPGAGSSHMIVFSDMITHHIAHNALGCHPHRPPSPPVCVTKSFSVFHDANAASSTVPPLLHQPFLLTHQPCLVDSLRRKKILDKRLSHILKNMDVPFDRSVVRKAPGVLSDGIW